MYQYNDYLSEGGNLAQSTDFIEIQGLNEQEALLDGSQLSVQDFTIPQIDPDCLPHLLELESINLESSLEALKDTLDDSNEVISSGDDAKETETRAETTYAKKRLRKRRSQKVSCHINDEILME